MWMFSLKSRAVRAQDPRGLRVTVARSPSD